MSAPLEYWTIAPEAIKHLGGYSLTVAKNFPDKKLLDLVLLRVSQLNGCAFCIDMHIHEAIQKGESQSRLNLVAAWPEAGDLFSPQERAALAWAESMTTLSGSTIADTHAREHAYEEIRKHFSDADTVQLGLSIAGINAWNRIAIGFHRQFKPH